MPCKTYAVKWPISVDITARDAIVEAALPAEAAVFAAAVADWRVANAAGSKMKKDGSGRAPALDGFAQRGNIAGFHLGSLVAP